MRFSKGLCAGKQGLFDFYSVSSLRNSDRNLKKPSIVALHSHNGIYASPPRASNRCEGSAIATQTVEQ